MEMLRLRDFLFHERLSSVPSRLPSRLASLFLPFRTPDRPR